MKVTIEIDCTPQEARAFFGQPDVEGFNAWMVEQMKGRFEKNLDLLNPEEMMKGWMAVGGQAQDAFRRFMDTAAAANPPPRKG
ncbi:MAG: DUF6489 family protein [Caulobacteraceae bacterium]